ncbi:family 43 glycosylhydrolase [Modestobacter italicus]|uniref:family 43 glycosylhydrolase n=1 Tax=Modestobacter italicus (strain DSM 44449 / CECT 9708 / BC 501) TaxID=2732864 RepID=UPI001C961516|nr:family 43 glycosylhydrolase [Modestobacter italicus]
MASTRTRIAAWVGGLLLGIGVLAPASAQAAPADARPGAPTVEPVIDANFPDPDVLLVDGVYHAYATNSDGQNVQHRTSRDLVHWRAQADVLPVLGNWVGECSFAPGGATDRCIWAPEVSAVPGGGYALYYTARDELAPRQCIGVAVAASPDGPFTPVGDQPLVCPDGARGTTDLGGAIDAATYTEDGQLYLLWKADGNCCPGLTAIIYLQPLSADGTRLTGPPQELIRRDRAFEGNVVEAPTLVKRGSTYTLFYSANDFGGGGYRTAYATSPSLTGPYTKATTELMTTDRFRGDVRGPGGQDVVTDRRGGTAILFHGWDPTYSYRAVYLSELEWDADGVPSVAAAGDRYQAEDGVLTRATVVPDPTASGGAKVGGMDFPDSSVTLQVTADRPGRATLAIRYANGSTDATGRLLATDRVTVNGRDAGVVTFAHTTWGNWQLVEHEVRLRPGVNTVTLTRLTAFAEIDAVDVHPGRPTTPPVAPTTDPADATRYEAEAGVVTNATVRPDPTASAGAVVGGLDFADSSVTVRVYAERNGRATLGIRFANGSERGGWPVEATHTVTVDGRDAGVVTYAHTTWGNWTTVEHEVRLSRGWNTVTLTRATFFAEVDAVDVS